MEELTELNIQTLSTLNVENHPCLWGEQGLSAGAAGTVTTQSGLGAPRNLL